jgi:PAS domain S-box-containing protein
MVPQLQPSLKVLFGKVVDCLPVGLVVLHRRNTGKARTWKVIASNSSASQLARPSFSSLQSMFVNQGTSRVPLDVGGICGQVAAGEKEGFLGYLRRQSRFLPDAYYSVKAFRLTSKCVGFLFEDATLLMKTTKELSETKAHVEQVCKSLRALLWRADPDTLEFTFVTGDTEKILGYWVERWRKETNFWKNHTHPEDWDLVQRECRRAVRDAKPVQFDSRMVAADGNVFWFQFSVEVKELRTGRSELAGIMADVTERKQAEQATRNLSANILLLQEEERRCVSRELYEGIGLDLVAAKLRLDDVLRPGEFVLEEKGKQTVRDCDELVQTSLKKVHALSMMLRPSFLEDHDLLAALRWYADVYSRWTGIAPEVDLPESIEPLDPQAETALFRVTQECLRNIFWHADTARAAIRLRETDREIVLEIEDHGVGVAPDIIERRERAEGGGIGLPKVREMVRLVNGTIEIHSSEMGTIVCVRIPRSTVAVEGGTARRGT